VIYLLPFLFIIALILRVNYFVSPGNDQPKQRKVE